MEVRVLTGDATTRESRDDGDVLARASEATGFALASGPGPGDDDDDDDENPGGGGGGNIDPDDDEGYDDDDDDDDDEETLQVCPGGRRLQFVALHHSVVVSRLCGDLRGLTVARRAQQSPGNRIIGF